MKVIKLKAHQTTANYKMPFARKTIYSSELPPYSSVIGMIHNACGFKEYVNMDISIQGNYTSKFWDKTLMVEFRPNYARKDYLESNKYDCVVENKNGKKTGIIKVPRDVQMLYGVTHIFHIYVEDDKVLKSIYESLKKPAEYPSLGRREDLLIIDDVKIVNVEERSLSEYECKYNIYIPLEYFNKKENIGTIFNVSKTFYIDEKTNLRKWSDIAKVVMKMESDIIKDTKFFIDDENDIVFLR